MSTDDGFTGAELELFNNAEAAFLGLAVRIVRSAMSLSQIEFGKRCNISARTLNKIESGHKSSDLTSLHKISVFLKRNDIVVKLGGNSFNISFPTDFFGGEYQDIICGLEEEDMFELYK